MRKTITCSYKRGRGGGREWGWRGVEEGAGVRLERRRRYAWLCDSSYIEHSVCVDTVSCISRRNKLFLLAQYRASSSPLCSSPPLSEQSAISPSPHIPCVSLPYLRVTTTSVLLSSVPAQYNHLKRFSSVFIYNFFLFLGELRFFFPP